MTEALVLSQAEASGFFVHESAYIDEPCEIGAGTKIWHFSHIMAEARIGRNCNIGQNVVISPEVVIGDNVKIQNNVSVYSGVIIEDDVFLGPSMVFTNVINPRSHIPRRHEFQKTLVRKGASIGANATILCGITIGRYAFIGAGAVVTRDVPDYALVYGIPAKIEGWMCQCGIKLSFHPSAALRHSSGQGSGRSSDGDGERTRCDNCGTAYVKRGQVVSELN